MTAMDATRILIAQHRTIAALLAEGALETRRRARARAVSRVAEELIAHVAAEEAVFYPALPAIFEVGAEAFEQGRRANLMLRIELRRLLETGVSEASFEERIESLRDLFLRHARDEESTLFPRAVRDVPASQLEALGAEILASRPPVWVVTTEARALIACGNKWALRASVNLPVPPRQ